MQKRRYPVKRGIARPRDRFPLFQSSPSHPSARSHLSPPSPPSPPRSSSFLEGWHGWDDYARFYDWENAQTLGRRDVAFWQRLAREATGPVLELGSGTGRITVPVGRIVRDRLVGVDRSDAMIARARRRLERARNTQVSLLRGDIRMLPFKEGPLFNLVIAPYGILQSLLSDSDLSAALLSVTHVMAPGALFGMDVVPDLPQWSEYRKRVRLRGFCRASRSHVTLIESVRQDRHRHLTFFDQEFLERRGAVRTRHSFSLAFRTLSVPQMRQRLENAGLRIHAVLGDYAGGPWDPRADVWVILARKAQEGGAKRSS